MPRRSAASYRIPSVVVQESLRAPSSLGEDERQLFVAIVAGAPSSHFRTTDEALLIGCRAVLAAQETSERLAERCAFMEASAKTLAGLPDRSAEDVVMINRLVRHLREGFSGNI
jgi:hypothetical protein